ncbi:hypothetical protein ACFPRL_09975 [Pseudoclavibacter helvolus]
MKPSSMACFIEYRSNACFVPLSSGRPNSSIVLPFGVAVNAKNEIDPVPTRRCITSASTSSASTDASLASASAVAAPVVFSLATSRRSRADAPFAPAVSTCLSLSAALPDCEECASSAITAYFRPARPTLFSMVSSAHGKV